MRRTLWAVSALLSATMLTATAAATGAFPAATGSLIRVSVDSSGTEANAHSRVPGAAVISRHGDRVVFQSDARLVAEDINDREDVYVRDLSAGTTLLISVDRSGQAAGGGGGSISADGRRVAFLSDVALTADDTSTRLDVFVRNLHTTRTRLVSTSSDGRQGHRDAQAAVISGDGRTVAFETAARLGPGDDDHPTPEEWKQLDVYAKHLATGRTRLVSVDTDGNNWTGSVALGGISDSGRRVGFLATGLEFSPGHVPAGFYVHDLRVPGSRLVWQEKVTGTTFALTNTPAISANGRYVAFPTDLPRVDDESDPRRLVDIVRVDLRTGRHRLVCCSPGPRMAAPGNATDPTLSRAGRFVAFSLEYGGVPSDDNDFADAYRVDLRTGRVKLVSRGPDGPGDFASSPDGNGVAVSRDGAHVVFDSYATNLVLSDTNSKRDVFLWSAPDVG